MNKSLIILRREYITRIKKKSFIVFTILFPLIMGGAFFILAWLAQEEDKNERIIAIHDESGLFKDKIGNTEYTHFTYISKEELEIHKNNIHDGHYYALLYIPEDIIKINKAEVFSKGSISFDIENMIKRQIEIILENVKKQAIIEQIGIPDLEERLAATRTFITLATQKVEVSGEVVKSSSGVSMVIGYIAGFLIYFFMMTYGAMVMQGVMEEKTSRIVEVLISSVKPFQLMFGKIVGVGLVGLTQLGIWAISGVLIMVGIENFSDSGGQIDATMANGLVETISGMNIPLVLGSFLFYFLTGFLFYSALMGAVGSAADSPEDTQQFMTPIMLPMFLSIMILIPVAKNPEGSLAFWASIIPFTSPIIMIARVPFGVPLWELLLSMVVMLASIYVVIRIAAKIYRIGILMYGKKVNYKEIAKWLRYKN